VYQLRYNSRTFHIEGMTGRTCGTLTRYMDTLARGAQTFDDLGAAVRNARIAARVNNMRVCGNCEEYAEKALSETDRNAQHYVNTLQSLDAGTDVQLYTFDGHTLAGVIADHGPEALTMTSVQGDPITVAYVDIESFEFYDEADENWVDPVTEAHAAAPDATLTAAVRHFVCLSCGATDETAKCTYTGSSAHRSPRRMLPADFQRYMASRRPVDKEAAAARREAIRAARTHLDRHAEESVEFDLAASEAARAQFLAARIAMAAGRTLRSCDGSEMRPHVIAPAYLIAERVDEAGNRFGVFVEGKFTVYADTLADAVASVPAALAVVATAASEPGDYAPTDCIAADLHECWSRALCEGIVPDVADASPALTEAAALDAAADAYTTAGDSFTALMADIHAAGDTALFAAQEAEREAWKTYRHAAAAAGACLHYNEGCREAPVADQRCCAHALPNPERPALAADGSCVERFTHDAIGYACCLGADAHDVHESSTGLRWIAGKRQPVHCPVSDCAACEETAAALVSQLPAAAWELTPEAAALAVRVGAALVGDTESGPGMTKFEVVLTQVVTTTVYVEAPDREAAVDLAVTELPELCGQCAGDRPRESAGVTDVHTSIADTYKEPEVTELDEYGRVKATPEASAAAAAAFARVMTAESIKRDGAWGADDALAPVRDNDDEETPRG
jgi:hypothetical protein